LLATGSEVYTFSTTDAGAGNAVKLVGNFLIASAIESIGEALALAESQGLDRTKVIDH
jgi:3-hydroxyisobutyrate dehydrogenase-like beta-hydroxyacid dehydrogenase